jgi:ureidoacrylate peracid hydrolase
MAYYRPEAQRRQAALVPSSSALLFIDVQAYNCSKDGAIYQSLNEEQRNSEGTRHFYERVEQCKPLWSSLQRACREAGLEVMYTVIQSLTADGRDRGLDYKLSGFHVPPGSTDAEMLPCIAPGPDEIMLPKTSSSVFLSTNIHYVLRSLGVRQLVLCGCVTEQCVEHAVRDACDAGYLVTLVSDACATYSRQRHEASLAAIAGYCRQRTTAELLAELLQVAGRQGAPPEQLAGPRETL